MVSAAGNVRRRDESKGGGDGIEGRKKREQEVDVGKKMGLCFVSAVTLLCCGFNSIVGSVKGNVVQCDNT